MIKEEFIKQITESAYRHVSEIIQSPQEHLDACQASLEDYLYGAFDAYNLINEDKLDYENIIYIIEGYNEIN